MQENGNNISAGQGSPQAYCGVESNRYMFFNTEKP